MILRINKILFFLILLPAVLFGQVNLENKYRLGKSYETAGELEKAKTIYTELLKAQPWNQRYITSLNNIYLKQKDYDASVEMLESILAVRKNDLNIYGILGTTYFILGDREKAYEVWDKALKVSPGSQTSYRIIANYAIENRAFDKAVDILEKGKAISDNPRLFVFDLANIHTANMKYGSAADEYCSLLMIEPLQLETVKRRIAAFVERPGAAQAVEESIIKNLAGNDNNTLKELLAIVFAMEKKFDEALELIIEIDQSSKGNGSALYKFAQSMFNDRQYDTASKCYRYLIENYNNSALLPSAKIGFAKTLELTTSAELDAAAQKWKGSSRIDTTGASKFNPVIDAFREIAKLYPVNDIAAEALLHIARIEFYRKLQADEAASILTDIILNRNSPLHSLESYLLLGDINIYRGRIIEALQNYTSAYKMRNVSFKKETGILYKIAQVYFWQAQFGKALELLGQVTQNLNDDNANNALELTLVINMNRQDSLNLAKYSKALFLVEQEKYDESENILLELYKDDNLLFLNKLAGFHYSRILVSKDRFWDALTVLNEIIDNRLEFNADKSLFLCGKIYQFGLKDNEKAISCYKNILESYPNSLYFDKSRELIKTLNNDGKTI